MNLEKIKFVLDQTSHPGNIGSAARAMKVMGLSTLHLVRPVLFPHAEATALASSADDLLDCAEVHESMDAALEDCTFIVGTSARVRSVAQPMLAPREAAARLTAESGPVAVVFGCERSGLDNTTLDRCHALVQVPTNPEYSSLNLAQAVQIMAYELRLAALAADADRLPRSDEAGPVPASDKRMAVFFERLEQTLRIIRFSTPGQDETLHRRLRRVFLRARPDDDELNILNGILSSTRKAAQGHDRAVEELPEPPAER